MLTRPKSKEQVIIDPHESWKEFFSSMINFSDPKVVPVSKLPKDYDPSKRRFQSLKSLVNWRNQNLIESYQPSSEQNEIQSDLERNELVANNNGN